MDRKAFIKYVEMLHRFEELSKEGKSIYSNPEEIKIMNDVRNSIEKNPELLSLVKKIHAAPDSERRNIVDEYFSKLEVTEEKTKQSEEEKIAKTFGIDASNINHQYLNNGKEIFSFYDSNLGRAVVLENNKNGKTLIECLEEIQNKSKKYQTENEEDNTKSILNDARVQENLEIKMYTKEEILNGFVDVNQKGMIVLQFLLKNYDNLKIKGINLENLIYIDEDGKIHEAYVNEKEEVIIGEPESEDKTSNEVEVIEEKNSEENESELNSMIEDNEKEEKLEDELENKQKKDKAKVLTLEKDNGFITNILYVAMTSAVLLLICLVYTIIKFYA